MVNIIKFANRILQWTTTNENIILFTAKRRSSIQDPRDLNTSCCDDMCLSRLNKAQLVKAREHYRMKYPTYRHQREHILDWFETNQPTLGNFVYNVCGITTCYKAFITVLGIPRSTFFSWKRDFCNGRVSPEHGAALTLKRSDVLDAATYFLQQFFENNCDYMPTGDVWHLPSSTSKIDVFHEMRGALRLQSQVSCSYTYFSQIWSQFFHHVKIPKVSFAIIEHLQSTMTVHRAQQIDSCNKQESFLIHIRYDT